MRTSTIEKKEPLVQKALEFMEKYFAAYNPLDFSIRFWEGTTWGLPEGDRPSFTLVIKCPDALRRIFLKADQLSVGEAFIYDDFDIEGDVEASFRLADYLQQQSLRMTERLRFGGQLLRLPGRTLRHSHAFPGRPGGRLHSRRRDADAVTYHYDVSNEFYRLWLDSRMCYSCAYFQTPGESIDEAQANKLEYICRKLRLKPGERLLDLGCGWGSLVLHAAKNFDIRAMGITLSTAQAKWAKRRIQQAGLEKQCRVEVADYRDIDTWGSFDKLVSVGMFEHVGQTQLDEYFKRAYALLKPGGVLLNHGISQQYGESLYTGPSFIDRYVFPDGELVPVSTTIHSAENCGFEVRDVESLREHYHLTLQHWVRRLEASKDAAIRLTDEVRYRIWRLYMAGSAYQFGKGRLNIYQMLLLKADNGVSGLPLTRSDWYS